MRFVFTLVVILALFVHPSGAGAVPNGALVHPGDKLHIVVTGEPDVSGDVVVSADGTIGLPLVGQVHVGGSSFSGAGASIADALKHYVRDPHVSVDILDEGTVTVTVLGDVVNAGRYPLRPGSTLSAAITAAGGMSDTIAGSYPVARIVNSDGSRYNISLELLLRGGDPTRDVVLRDNSVVYVPGPAQFDVVVLGAVDHPGTISINEGDRLSIAIAKAGNSTSSHADLTHIRVSRTESNGVRAAHPVDLYEALEKGDRRYDPSLQAGDIVYVPIARENHGSLTDAVFLLSRLFFL